MPFSFSPIGAPFFLPHGTRIINRLKEYLKRQCAEQGYDEVMTPSVFNKELWQRCVVLLLQFASVGAVLLLPPPLLAFVFCFVVAVVLNIIGGIGAALCLKTTKCPLTTHSLTPPHPRLCTPPLSSYGAGLG